MSDKAIDTICFTVLLVLVFGVPACISAWRNKD